MAKPPKARPKSTATRGNEPDRAPSYAHLEALIEAVPDGVILFGRVGELLAMNGGFAELYGVSDTERQRLDADAYLDLLLSRLGPASDTRVRKRIGRGRADSPTPVKVLLEVATPRRRLVSVYSAPALDREGRTFGWFAFHRDVTKEHNLLAQAQERADLPDINPIPLFKCDTLARVLFMNVAAERLLVGVGLTREKANRMFPRSLMQMIRRAVNEGTGARTSLHEYKGRFLTFTLSPHPRQPHCMVLVEDVTEQREAQQAIRRYAAALESKNRELRETQTALVQSEKMASLGSLVAGVAHEINTPLGSINSNADVILRALSKVRTLLDSDSGEENTLAQVLGILDEIGRVNKVASGRIVEIVGSLRSFARLDEAERKRVDLHEGLESTLLLVDHEFKSRIEIFRDYGEQVPEVECAPNQINQVFMNILVNAAHAIEETGRVSIATRSEGDFVTVSFSDTGRGIDPKELPNIFDPGFTTKGVGVGTGLGLAICYRIINEHRGTIEVHSGPGQGTTFTVRLPATRAAESKT